MEKFLSSWSDGEKLPESYIFPPGKRPGKVAITTSKNIPVIDIGKAEGLDRSVIIQQIMQASQEFGFFQVINHGVPYTLLNDTRGVFEEFFVLPAEEKTDLCSSDESKSCIYLTSNVDFDREKYHNWRDTLRLNCAPLEERKQGWAPKPAKFRDIVGDFTTEANNLGLRILELICEGLGLEGGYFGKEMSRDQLLVVHHYPPCPNPSLTLGTRSHKDPGLITILLQGNISGLQVLKDGEWIGIKAVPDAFVVNVGCVLQLVSNGKLQSVEHRVVTNKERSRISAAFFITPESNCVVEPAKDIVNAGNCPIYKSVRFADFVKMFKAAYNGEVDDVFGSYMI
ncbi:hypothetical protein RND81_07G015000 [Saponaria officinalis]|uniref:Fe2OG dioxygenase domain-containing protein n=1 Tax=Saponaria officinalis TaxID=3572 RepID=A0AAW1JKW2_SAPOF